MKVRVEVGVNVGEATAFPGFSHDTVLDGRAKSVSAPELVYIRKVFKPLTDLEPVDEQRLKEVAWLTYKEAIGSYNSDIPMMILTSLELCSSNRLSLLMTSSCISVGRSIKSKKKTKDSQM